MNSKQQSFLRTGSAKKLNESTSKITGSTSKLTGSASKLTGNTSKLTGGTSKNISGIVSKKKNLQSTPVNSHVSRNLISSSTISLTENIENIQPVIDMNHSQKVMQHKLDMGYNKYLQTLAFEAFLSKHKYSKEEQMDLQIFKMEETHEKIKEMIRKKQVFLNDMQVIKSSSIQFQLLNKSLELTNIISEKYFIEKVQTISETLHTLCNKLIFKKIIFTNTEENYEELQNILEKISITLIEITDTFSEEFLLFTKNIFEIIELMKKLRQNDEFVKSFQDKINYLVLRKASMELNKGYENTN